MSETYTSCTKCDRTILIATADRNNGLCRVCARELNRLRSERTRVVREFAANSAEELQLLRAMVRQLDAIPPKEVYADWLAQNGQTSRAEFLRKTIAAHKSLAAGDLPDFDSVDSCWSRMIGATYFRALIEHGGGLTVEQRTTLRDRVFRLAEPAIVIRYQKSEVADPEFQPEVGLSRYFGEPDLPPDMEWPTYGDCLHDFEDTDGKIARDSPCFFACQIRTKELWPMVAGDLARTDKMLYFFTFVETESLGSQSVCVLTAQDVNNLQRRRQPPTAHADNRVIEARQIYFSEELSLPETRESRFEKELALGEFGEDGQKVYEMIAGSGYVPFHPDLPAHLPMFGYLQASTGGDPSPTTGHRRLMLVRCSLTAGILHLGIDARSLKEEAWEASTIVWQDWDS